MATTDRANGRTPAMRYAFSTLGVPGMPVPEVLRLATGAGYQGVELRAHPEEPVHPLLGARERAAVRGQFADAGVEILAVAGYAQVAAARDAAGEEELAQELAELVRLAADLGAPYVRVFPGGGDRPAAEADADAARRLAAVAPLAAERGVRVLMETHDSHGTGAAAARVLGLVGHRRVGALWDVLHSWLGGEEPVDTHAALAPHLGYVQVKDVASAEDRTPSRSAPARSRWRPPWAPSAGSPRTPTARCRPRRAPTTRARGAGSAGSTRSAGTRRRPTSPPSWPRAARTSSGSWRGPPPPDPGSGSGARVYAPGPGPCARPPAPCPTPHHISPSAAQYLSATTNRVIDRQ